MSEQSIPVPQKDTIKVLFIASEAEPLVKVGGLGDVAYSLPFALRRLKPGQLEGTSLDVRLVLPCHPVIREKCSAKPLMEFSIPSSYGPQNGRVGYTELNGLPTYLIAGDPIPSEGPVYSSDNHLDGKKYFFFSLAALELARHLDWKPDILHANDWHTAVAVAKVSELRQKDDPFFKDCRSILSIHNLPFMGSGTDEELFAFGIRPSDDRTLPEWARHIPLPIGLATADYIIAVSPTYAKEILTTDFGCGLHDFLKTRESKVTGIINGLDQQSWDPSIDPSIVANFDAFTLYNRPQNKQYLLREFSLDPDPTIPLLILISRFDPQKGVDIAIEALREIKDLPWQAILLGTGYSKLEEDARRLEAELPSRVRAAIRFDQRLSRCMYAGGDILLMPSRYEPCGIAQMMAMRYGCIPAARATGGLKDTIIDVDSGQPGTGFLFSQISAPEFAQTLRRAIRHFKERADWIEIQKRCMKKDFSWEKSAITYAQLYKKLQGEKP